jgi:uncharacterized protein
MSRVVCVVLLFFSCLLCVACSSVEIQKIERRFLPDRWLSKGDKVSAAVIAPAPKPGEDKALFERGLAAEIAGEWSQARVFYEKAIDGGSPYAAYRLGEMILQGNGGPLKEDKAMSYFEQASKGGLSAADVLLGDSYFLGRGTVKSFEKAAEAYLRAAEHDHPYAQYMLSIFYKEGLGVTANLHRSLKWFFKADSLTANADAKYRIGRLYQRGDGFVKDPKEALLWMERAAKDGDEQALVALGDFYREGKTVPRNYELALVFYNQAQEKGSAYAQYNIGMMYYNNEGVPRNDIEAARWFSLAAKNGAEHAQYRLAQMFYDGMGVPQDDVQAFAWWSLSANHKVEGSHTPDMKKLIARMSPEQQRRALLLAEDYKRQYGSLLQAPEDP